MIILNDQGGSILDVSADVTATLRAEEHGHQPVVCYSLQGGGATFQNSQGNGIGKDVCFTLNAIDRHGVVYPVENHPNDSRVKLCEDGVVQTLSSRMGTGGGNVPMVLEDARCVWNGQLHQTDLGDKTGALNCMHDQQAIMYKTNRKYIVRRLTPLECCRLQGFPDWWLDGVEGSDSAKYKLWGNGIALPCAMDVLGRIAKELEKEEDHDMG